MKTLLTTAAVALSLTSAAVAAPQFPDAMQGEYCLKSSTKFDKVYQPNIDLIMTGGECSNPNTMIKIKPREVIFRDDSPFCTVLNVKPWGMGLEVSLRCGGKLRLEHWFPSKGRLAILPVEKNQPKIREAE